jgi:hypothetical protein
MKPHLIQESTGSSRPNTSSIRFSIKQIPSDQTSGTSGITAETTYLPISGSAEFIESARGELSKIKDHELLQTVSIVLGKIQTVMAEFMALGSDISNMPKLYGFTTEDSSFQLEWVAEKFRVGLSIESKERDLSWYLVTDRELGDLNASGFVAVSDLERILRDLTHFMVTHT